MNLSFLGPIGTIYSIVRVLIILTDIALLFTFLYAAAELFAMRTNFVFDPRKASHGHKKTESHSPKEDTNAWDTIKDKVKVGTPEAIRLAIIEADGFVDNILKKKGYEGDTFADRLSKVNPSGMDSIDDLWASHRLRNEIVHTPGFSISAANAEEAIHHYEAFLKEIGALKTVPHEAPPDIPFLEIPNE
jgi:hypothetical protein